VGDVRRRQPVLHLPLLGPHPDRIVANDMRRDTEPAAGDNFGLVLDTFHDKRNGSFYVRRSAHVR
jgi:hypothetical protein